MKGGIRVADFDEAAQLPEGMIGIVASADENYAKHLAVMFISLLKNTVEPSRVCLFCLDGGIGIATRTAMEKEVANLGGRLKFLAVDTKKYNGFKTNKRFTAAAYYRISIPEIFSHNVDKLIYLDCDIIIKSDISELWAANIQNYHIAAVENIARKAYKKSGLKQSDYFNSGILVINLDLWRRDDISGKVRNFLSENEQLADNDQDALNGVLFDSWKRLPLKWNHQTGLYRKSKQFDLLSPQEIEEANLMPSAIHYIGWDKPWRAICFHPLAGEYKRYADMAAFVDIDIKEPNFFEKIQAYGSMSNLKRLWRKKRLTSWYRVNDYKFYHPR
jgi:lipopolysaccharide biosynthesis glycosyltransferase